MLPLVVLVVLYVWSARKPSEKRKCPERMTLLSVLPHGATGTWIDEIFEFGLPLLVLIALYFWSSRKPKEKEKPK